LASGGLFWFVKIAVDSIAQRQAKKSPLETGKEDNVMSPGYCRRRGGRVRCVAAGAPADLAN
jgi:hypothetical protein